MCFSRHAFGSGALYPHTCYWLMRELMFDKLARVLFFVILNSHFIRRCARRWFLSMLCIFRARNQCLLFRMHRISPRVAWRKASLLHTRWSEFRAGTYYVFVVFFVLGWRERWKHLNAQNEKHCIIMCASIALVNFFHSAFIWSCSFVVGSVFFSLSSVLLECAIDVSRTASYVYFFFHISKGGRQLFFGGVACICGFKIAVCVTLFASSYIISSTTWTSSFCYNSFWFFLSECMCIPSRALLLLKATNLVIPEPDECRLCWSSTHSAVPAPFKMNCTRSKCFYPNLTHLNFEIWPAGRCKLIIDMW